VTPVDVTIRPNDCPCPGTPHTEEHVYLEGEASIPLCIYAYKMLSNTEATWQAKETAMLDAYIPRAITAWTFTGPLGPDGEPGDLVPITRANAERLIPWDQGGYEVLEQANHLYSDRVLAPFFRSLGMTSPQTSRALPTGPKDGSISATPPSGSRPRGQSRPSSPTSSAG
jgi:hypothetical protein